MSKIHAHVSMYLHNEDENAIEASTLDLETLPGNPLRHKLKLGEEITIHLTDTTLSALVGALSTLLIIQRECVGGDYR
jgi:hypothetical protein